MFQIADIRPILGIQNALFRQTLSIFGKNNSYFIYIFPADVFQSMHEVVWWPAPRDIRKYHDFHGF